MKLQTLFINIGLNVYKKLGVLDQLDWDSKDKYVTQNYLRCDKIYTLKELSHYKTFKCVVTITDYKLLNKEYFKKVINIHYKNIMTETNLFKGGLIDSEVMINKNKLILIVDVAYAKTINK